MKAAAARHTGLPFVPQPAPDELLGSWLLRLAQLYGLGLRTLLCRLGALQARDAHLPHWFSIDGSTVNLDALSAAARLSRADLQAMTPLGCRPRWPAELGACERCLAAAAEAGQPITWRRTWMNPLATACDIHGTWLKPVAARTLASIRHGGDFGGVVQRLAMAPQPDDEPAWVSDALWLQDLCTARADADPPWGRTRLQDLIRIVDETAREETRQASVQSVVLELGNSERAGLSLSIQLRHRQWVMGSVGRVLRWPSEERVGCPPWSTASIKRLAMMRDWPQGALAWICPPAAELVRQQEALRQEFSISPRYFKSCASLFSSIQ